MFNKHTFADEFGARPCEVFLALSRHPPTSSVRVRVARVGDFRAYVESIGVGNDSSILGITERFAVWDFCKLRRKTINMLIVIRGVDKNRRY